jgi:hypothetical protein
LATSRGVEEILVEAIFVKISTGGGSRIWNLPEAFRRGLERGRRECHKMNGKIVAVVSALFANETGTKSRAVHRTCAGRALTR